MKKENWYKLGKRHAAHNYRLSETSNIYNYLTKPGMISEAFYLAGFYGCEMPTKKIGYRFGKAPIDNYCGGFACSHNFRDNTQEAGISMAKVEGGKTCRSFAADGGRKYYYKGYVMTHATGSDGEALMCTTGIEEIEEIEL